MGVDSGVASIAASGGDEPSWSEYGELTSNAYIK